MTIHVLFGVKFRTCSTFPSRKVIKLIINLKFKKNSFLDSKKKKYRSKRMNEKKASEKAIRCNLGFCYNDKKKNMRSIIQHFSLFNVSMPLSLKYRLQKHVRKCCFNQQQAFENSLKMKYVR